MCRDQQRQHRRDRAALFARQCVFTRRETGRAMGRDGHQRRPAGDAARRRRSIRAGRFTSANTPIRSGCRSFGGTGKNSSAAGGGLGDGPGEFSRAEGIGIDAQDRIYVADSCNHRIQIFSADGRFLRAYGKAGSGAGQFSYPYDMQVDAAGLQYVCEFGNSRIQIFDAHDQPLEILGGAGRRAGAIQRAVEHRAGFQGESLRGRRVESSRAEVFAHARHEMNFQFSNPSGCWPWRRRSPWVVWLSWKSDVQIGPWRHWTAMGLRLLVVLALAWPWPVCNGNGRSKG